MTVFVDAGPLRALVVPRDQHRRRAILIADQLQQDRASLVTTDYVIDEVFTGLLGDRKAGFYRIREFDENILQKNMLQIEWMTPKRFLETKIFFLKASKDKQWSFTDCMSYVVMRERKIKTAFSFDEHVREMGIKLL